MSAVENVELVGGRMSYIILRSRWYGVVVMNMDVPTENKKW
jgi:hypothetical protein